jgi:hypothetical protein
MMEFVEGGPLPPPLDLLLDNDASFVVGDNVTSSARSSVVAAFSKKKTKPGKSIVHKVSSDATVPTLSAL